MLSERRLARVAITSEFLFEMMTIGFRANGAIETMEGLPPGAVFISSHFDALTMEAHLLFAHESFCLISPGDAIPLINVRFQKFEITETPNV